MESLRRVIKAVGELGVDTILALEKRDPQYLSVCRVVSSQGEEIGARLSMLNALVSYRLAGKGEEHWSFFASYFTTPVSHICVDFSRYVRDSPYLRLSLSARLRRVEKICSYSPDLTDLKKTWLEIAERLGTSPRQKTVVFAVKILNYAYMCSRGESRLAPMEVPIPVDYRVAHLTRCAGLTDTPPEVAVKKPEEVQELWSAVASAVGIPPLHLDTLLWLAGRAVLHGENIHQVPESFLNLFANGCRPLSKWR